METSNLEKSLIKFYPTSQLISILERGGSEEDHVKKILNFRLEKKYHLPKGVSTLLMKRDQEIIAEREFDREKQKKKAQQIKQLRKELEQDGWFDDENESEKESFVIRYFERLNNDFEFCEYKEFLDVIDYRDETKDREFGQLFDETRLNDWNFAPVFSTLYILSMEVEHYGQFNSWWKLHSEKVVNKLTFSELAFGVHLLLLRIGLGKKKLKNVENLDDLKKLKDEILVLKEIKRYLYEFLDGKLSSYYRSLSEESPVELFRSFPPTKKCLKYEGNLCELYFNEGVVSGFQKKLFNNYSITNRIIVE